jgi:uncharacterized protein DUF4430
MTGRLRPIAIAAVVLIATAATGCSIGPGGGSSTVVLTVTRDFGAVSMLRDYEPDVPGNETAMRLLQSSAKVETRYGGRFVNAINGLRSGSKGGSRRDWFYYVNGIEAEVGAADRDVHSGDHIWWDYHEWGAVMRVPAVVGSFPEPFVHGSEGKRFPVRIDCAKDTDEVCRQLAGRLDRAGITASTTALGAPAGEEVQRFVVGRWEDVRGDGAAHLIEEGPKSSGVFARFAPANGGYRLELMDSLGRSTSSFVAGAGLVAATRFKDQQPTWVITGTDDAGLARAIGVVDRKSLRDRFAVATTPSGAVALPQRANERGSR